MTQTTTHQPVRTDRPSPPTRAWALAGACAPALSFIGVHVMHPPGAPEHMTDAQVVEWITPAAGRIVAGGTLGLISCMLLLLFARGWYGELVGWGAPHWAAGLADTSITTTAAALAVGALLQVTAGLTSLPSEATGQPSLAATLVNLYGALATGAWVLLAPAVWAGLCTIRRGRRWAAALSIAGSIALVLCLALPPVSWAPAGVWLIAMSLGCLATSSTQRVRESEMRGR